jgi:hypothetical protein
MGLLQRLHLSTEGRRARHYDNPEVQERETVQHSGTTPVKDENIGRKRFADFDLAGGTFVVTGGAQGLGLMLAEALVEAGGNGAEQATTDHSPL